MRYLSGRCHAWESRLGTAGVRCNTNPTTTVDPPGPAKTIGKLVLRTIILMIIKFVRSLRSYGPLCQNISYTRQLPNLVLLTIPNDNTSPDQRVYRSPSRETARLSSPCRAVSHYYPASRLFITTAPALAGMTRSTVATSIRETWANFIRSDWMGTGSRMIIRVLTGELPFITLPAAWWPTVLSEPLVALPPCQGWSHPALPSGLGRTGAPPPASLLGLTLDARGPRLECRCRGRLAVGRR